MNELVLNTDDYTPYTMFDIPSLKNKNNNFIEQLKEQDTLPNLRYDKCTFIARIYGLTKIHKINHPLRPIVSSCASSGFSLAKVISEILSKTPFDLQPQYKTPLLKQTNMIKLISTRGNVIFDRYSLEFPLLQNILLFLSKDCAVFSFDSVVYKQKAHWL